MAAARPALLLAVTVVSLVPPVASSRAQEPFRPAPRRPDAVKALLVTGGHDHDVSTR